VIFFLTRFSLPYLYSAVFLSFMLTVLLNKGKDQPTVVPTPPMPPVPPVK
jgi:hypothetical protein